MVAVTFTEPARGPWTGNRAWGSRYSGPLPIPGKVIPITELTDIPGPPRPITVQLTRDNPDGAANNLECYARVIYGAGAASNVLLMDWSQGATASVVASSIKVEALGVAGTQAIGYGQQKTVALGVSFGMGAAAPAVPATYTVPLAVVSDSGVIYPGLAGTRVRRALVPQFAKRVIPYGPDVEKLFDSELSELGAYGPGLFTKYMAFPPSAFTIGAGLTEGVLLPGHTREVVYRTSGSSFEQVGFIFVLAV